MLGSVVSLRRTSFVEVTLMELTLIQNKFKDRWTFGVDLFRRDEFEREQRGGDRSD